MTNTLLDETEDTSIDELLENTTTLKVFLYLRLHANSWVGIRDTQRELEVKSPSTISWHFNKLEEAGFVEKNDANRYRLSDKGQMVSSIQVPTNVTFSLVRDMMISPKIFQLAFLIAGLILGIGLSFYDPLIGVVNLSLIILITIITIIREYQKITGQINTALDQVNTRIL